MQSVTIGPLAPNASCAPAEAEPTPPPLTWGQFARVCRGAPPGACSNDLLCVPPQAAGFLRCVSVVGVYDCSAPYFAPYTQTYVFYAGLDDARTCAPCGCGAPTGASCSAAIALYADGACTSAATDAGSVGSAVPVCVDLDGGPAPGITLQVEPAEHGACEPTGGDAGRGDPDGADDLLLRPPP